MCGCRAVRVAYGVSFADLRGRDKGTTCFIEGRTAHLLLATSKELLLLGVSCKLINSACHAYLQGVVERLN
jgi:hypothetical protein